MRRDDDFHTCEKDLEPNPDFTILDTPLVSPLKHHFHHEPTSFCDCPSLVSRHETTASAYICMHVLPRIQLAIRCATCNYTHFISSPDGEGSLSSLRQQLVTDGADRPRFEGAWERRAPVRTSLGDLRGHDRFVHDDLDFGHRL